MNSWGIDRVGEHQEREHADGAGHASAQVAGRSGFGRFDSHERDRQADDERTTTDQMRRPAGRSHGIQSGMMLNIGRHVVLRVEEVLVRGRSSVGVSYHAIAAAVPSRTRREAFGTPVLHALIRSARTRCSAARPCRRAVPACAITSAQASTMTSAGRRDRRATCSSSAAARRARPRRSGSPQRGSSRARGREEAVPREKTCGDGLTPAGRPPARTTWASPSRSREFHRFDGLRSIAHGVTLELAWPEHPDFPPYGYVVRRRDLDEMVADRP